MKAALLLLSAATVASAADLTIYNQGFAVVRDTVPLTLKAGVNDVHFAGATAQVEADSVILRDASGKFALQILEQSYRNDPVSEKLLLSQFEGKTLRFFRQEPAKPDTYINGKVVRSGYVPGGQAVEPIIEVDGHLVFDLPGRPLFPALEGDNVLKPTLGWKIQAAADAKFDAELAYLSDGFSWEASYNVVQPEQGDEVDLTGWVTMTNASGTAFTGAKVKLMAGDVQRTSSVQWEQPQIPQNFGRAPAPVSEKSFDEYHLYTLANPISLRDKETKQVEFVRAAGVKAGREYRYEGVEASTWQVTRDKDGTPQPQTVTKKVQAYRLIENRVANKLGIALPKGKVRFYTKETEGGALQFIGENYIDHSPKDERLRILIGNSFDLVGDRKTVQTDTDVANQTGSESLEIKLRNRKTTPVEIIVVEHLDSIGHWEIVEKSQAFEKADANTIEFHVALKPDEEKTVTYKAKYKW
jgi:hypothetical protein